MDIIIFYGLIAKFVILDIAVFVSQGRKRISISQV
jgi:hypothetical protein